MICPASISICIFACFPNSFSQCAKRIVNQERWFATKYDVIMADNSKPRERRDGLPHGRLFR